MIKLLFNIIHNVFFLFNFYSKVKNFKNFVFKNKLKEKCLLMKTKTMIIKI